MKGSTFQIYFKKSGIFSFDLELIVPMNEKQRQ